MLDSSIFLIRQPRGAAALRPAGDDAPTGFILSANNRRDRELFIRYWLVQRDTAQPFFSDRPTLDEAPQSVRQTNATHIPPIRPFEAVSDIAQYRGDLAAGGLSNLYIPERDRHGVALTFENAGIALGTSLAINVLQEFVLHRLTSRKQ